MFEIDYPKRVKLLVKHPISVAMETSLLVHYHSELIIT